MSNLGQALAHITRELYIFPCEDKRPVFTNWQNQATLDPDIIDEWWSRYPDDNIGVACGLSSVIVVDLDVKNGIDGVAAFDELLRAQGLTHWPDTYTVKTPSGGYHLYFWNTGDHGNSTGSLPKGIDIRGKGGLVIGAGSSIDGNFYECVNSDAPIEMPDFLWEIIQTPGPSAHSSVCGVNEDLTRMPETLIKKKVNGILDWLDKAQPGERNNSLFWASCKLGDYVAAGRIVLGEAERLLEDSADVNGYSGKHGSLVTRRTILSGFSRAGLS
jgi:hypothetical protein